MLTWEARSRWNSKALIKANTVERQHSNRLPNRPWLGLSNVFNPGTRSEPRKPSSFAFLLCLRDRANASLLAVQTTPTLLSPRAPPPGPLDPDRRGGGSMVARRWPKKNYASPKQTVTV